MDTLTHALIGATLARATAPATVTPGTLPLRSRVWLGGLAAAFPDIDYFTVLIDPLSFISDWHRAETHSLVMLPLWALLLGVTAARVLRRKPQWPELALICAISIASHIMSDFITSWGTQIFAPLSDYRASLGTTFIIDPYFSFIVLSGLVVSMLKGSRAVAQGAMLLLVAYVGLQAVMKWQAYEVAKAELAKYPWQATQIHTMPQPFSPFNWKIIIREGEHYHMAYLDLIAGEDKPPAVPGVRTLRNLINHYRPSSQLNWTHYSRYGEGDIRAEGLAAWWRPELERYRRFAAFPAFRALAHRTDSTCIGFLDLRFTLPQRRPVFSYAACVDREDSTAWRVLPITPESFGSAFGQ
jgi:inner membrane protein